MNSNHNIVLRSVHPRDVSNSFEIGQHVFYVPSDNPNNIPLICSRKTFEDTMCPEIPCNTSEEERKNTVNIYKKLEHECYAGIAFSGKPVNCDNVIIAAPIE